MLISVVLGGTMAWLLLSGLPTTITKDDIERLLNASVEAVLHVNILEEGEKMATVKVMGLKGERQQTNTNIINLCSEDGVNDSV